MNLLKNLLCLVLLTARSDGTIASLQPRSCNHDNCLDALLKASGTNAASFCHAASIGSLNGVTANLNTECSGSIERALSACACITFSTTSRTTQISFSTISVLSSFTGQSSSSVIKTSGLSSSFSSRSSSSSRGNTSPSSSPGPSSTVKVSVSSSSNTEKTTPISSPRSSSSTIKSSTTSLQKTTSVSSPRSSSSTAKSSTTSLQKTTSISSTRSTSSTIRVSTPTSSSNSKFVSSSFSKPTTTSLALSSSTNTKTTTKSQTKSSSIPPTSLSHSSTTSSSSISVTSSATSSSATVGITGIEFNLITSPRSCYTLPIPTTIAVSLPWEDTINTTIGEPVDVYFLEAEIVPGFYQSLESIREYGVNYNGSYIVLDASSSLYWGFVSNAGQALVINDTGVFLFAEGCSLALTATIPNFTSQLQTIASSSSSSSFSDSTNQNRKRSMSTLNNLNAFDVMVTIYNQCGEPANNANPQVLVQSTPCNLIAELVDGTWLFGCTFNGLAYCENDMENQLEFLTNGWPESIPDAWDDLKKIGEELENTVKSGWSKIFSTAATGLVELTEDVFLERAIGLLGILQAVVKYEGAPAVAVQLCSSWQNFVNIVNQYTAYAEVNCNSNLGFFAVTDLTAVPTTTMTISVTTTLTDPSITCTACPTPLTLCGSDCVDTTSDVNNCGACGHVCDCACVYPPDVCTNSKCVPGSFF